MDDKIKISYLVTKKGFKEEIKKVYKKFEEIDKRFDKIDKRFETIEAVLREEIRITAEETKQEIKEEISKQNQRILDTMDDFLKEIKQTREERILIPNQISNHEKRISKLETKISQIKKPAFA